MTPGSPQDQQRGSIYAPLFAEAGVEVSYVGRRPIDPFERNLALTSLRVAHWLRTSIPYRTYRRVENMVVTATNDRRIARMARDADVVLFIKVDSPTLIDRIRRSSRSRLVYDLADVQRAASGHVKQILSMVDAVTVDNTIGMAFAQRHHPSVHLWPPLSYVERFDALRSRSRRGRDSQVVLGWLGSETTVENLSLIVEPIGHVLASHPTVRLRLVGVPREHEVLRELDRRRVTCRPAYDQDEMLREVNDMDVGLFPNPDDPDAAMHGITKALIYMGGGAVVIGSPVGDLPVLLGDGETGILASVPSEWTAALRGLIGDPAHRERLARAGLRTVRERYSLVRCFDHLRAALAL